MFEKAMAVVYSCWISYTRKLFEKAMSVILHFWKICLKVFENDKKVFKKNCFKYICTNRSNKTSLLVKIEKCLKLLNQNGWGVCVRGGRLKIQIHRKDF